MDEYSTIQIPQFSCNLQRSLPSRKHGRAEASFARYDLCLHFLF